MQCCIKGIGSILFLKNGLKKNFAEKTIKIISEVIIMRYVQLQHFVFSNILDVMVLENINLSEDRNWVTVIVV
jgi:hypothetical protein